MSETQTIPCVELPDLPQLKISLPFGVELNSIADFSKGPPSNCSLIQSLLVQLSPALAGMECLFKMLKLLSVLAKLPPNPIDLAKAVAALADCFLFPAQIVCMIVDILKLILAFLLCIIESVESLLNFQAGISLSTASGNPTVLASLNCAQNNATASANQLKQALQLIAPLLTIITSIMDLAPSVPGPINDVMGAIPKAITAIASVLNGGGASVGVPGAAGPLETLEKVRGTLAELQALLNAIPC